ncbi:AI-2E family transporter [Chryseosolibacter indicus]|uniref:AI-2E family transporter n=1 Tax=Chryseosolibacter indicus TaxID=2782351 RepID=A0ABS5VWA5_9BACT|nr:AI-2E family transporter [Chryseosolibacter indicus]MBT1705707.1 AI-2E family transporter [Chryseosolibacter indicus]
MREIFQRVNQYLFFFVLVSVVLYFGKTILIPIIFAALLAMLMAPVCRYLDKKGFKRALSSLCCILIILFTFLGILATIGGQFAAFSKDVPKIKEKATAFIKRGQDFIEQKLGVPPEQQKEVAKQQAQSMQQGGGAMVTKFLGGVTSTIAGIVLTLVYTFLMIYNKEHFENFFVKLYKDKDEDEVRKLVSKIASVAQKYLTGRAMSVLIIATLYSIGLSIVGLKNAILLAGVAAILTVIPYVGTVLGGLFPVITALATESSAQTALYAALVLFIIQTLDNYFIEPNVVGGEVNLSAIVSIATLIIGGIIWGVAGMILFLPITGIIKIICDNVEPLQPIGFILGEPGGKKPSKIKMWIQEKFASKKKH